MPLTSTIRLVRVALVVAIVSLGLPAAASAIVVVDRDAFGGPGGLIQVDSATGARTTVSENNSPLGGAAFVDPSDVVRASNGDMLVVDINAFGGGGGVIRVNPATGARTTVSENASPAGGPSFVDPFGIALAANGDILVADQNAFGGGGGVIRVNPATGARTTVSENANPAGGPAFDAPWGIKVLANGNILVADAGAFSGGGGVISVDPVTGARTTFSANGAPAGGPDFSDPIQLALAAKGGVLVTDPSVFGGTGAVFRLDPANGARTLVSSNTSPAGDPAFAGPLGIAVAANGDILIAGFTNAGPDGGVTRVNPLTGTRATVSVNTSPTGGPSFALPSSLLPDATLRDLAPPVLGRSVNVEPASGRVLVAVPRRKGLKYVPLREARHVPVGSFFNTKKGSVRIQTATQKRGKRQAGNFSKGLFQLLQSRKAKGLTELRLKGSSFKSCAPRGKRATASLSKRAIRRLRASAKGKFRTRGRYSAATVRGTEWTVTDRCDGTLTTVKRGKVAVRDFRRKKTVLVRTGKRYLARPKAG